MAKIAGSIPAEPTMDRSVCTILEMLPRIYCFPIEIHSFLLKECFSFFSLRTDLTDAKDVSDLNIFNR